MSKTKDKGNKRRAELLGMPFGTASNRLRKSIIFDLSSRLNLDVCFRCGEKILDVDSLSIEHKDSWMNSSDPIGSFFDLDNIAFSHLTCNKPQTFHGSSPKIGPEGTSWCPDCDEYLPTEDFFRNTSKRDGFSSYCKYHTKNRVVSS
jgi:hypothetical protein